jgi:hypothetical protein
LNIKTNALYWLVHNKAGKGSLFLVVSGKCHYLHGKVVTTVRHVNLQSHEDLSGIHLFHNNKTCLLFLSCQQWFIFVPTFSYLLPSKQGFHIHLYCIICVVWNGCESNFPMRKTTVKMRCFLYSSSSKTTNPTFLSPRDVRCPFLACVALLQTHLYLGFHLDLYQTNDKQYQPRCPREICRKPEIETKYESN